jgi:hypothetical protein
MRVAPPPENVRLPTITFMITAGDPSQPAARIRQRGDDAAGITASIHDLLEPPPS